MDYKTEAQPKATAGGVPVFCAHDAIVAIEKLIPNPKNPNTHPDAQIQALGRIIRQTGWRAPITVSKRSGFIVKGHGRLAAAKLEGLTEVPVDYQNYTNEARNTPIWWLTTGSQSWQRSTTSCWLTFSPTLTPARSPWS